VYIGHTPAGTSVKNMAHWAQMVRQNRFQKYDYGIIGNVLHYGSAFPPQYDLSKVQVPVVLFSGDKDTLSDPKDVDRIVKALPNLIDSTILPE
jgi:hypothetical protein